jgi:hypothetical protein
MLVLDQSLVFNQTFMPICLMQENMSEEESRTSSLHHNEIKYITAGWGNSNRGFSIIDNDCLNEADLDQVPDFACRLHYGTYLNTEKIMCAGGHTNICNGDSGGPLMVRKDGIVYLKALTSFGRTDCGLVTKQPSGFEKITPHLDWIIRRTLLSSLCFGKDSNMA